jgi:hypothetical protein
MESEYERLKHIIYGSYVDLLMDFFVTMSKSKDLSLENIRIGINTINRVFEYTLTATKCIEKTKYYSQKSYCYYLEYIEQVGELYLSQTLNHMDAVLFVYRKTIFDLENDDSDKSANIFSINSKPITMDEENLHNMLSNAFKLTNVLLYWKNKTFTFLNRQAICKTFLNKLIKKNDNLEIIYSHLEMIQHKICMNYHGYCLLLTELCEKKIKRQDPTDYNDIFLIKFYIEETMLLDKFNSGNMKEFVKWLYSN